MSSEWVVNTKWLPYHSENFNRLPDTSQETPSFSLVMRMAFFVRAAENLRPSQVNYSNLQGGIWFMLTSEQEIIPLPVSFLFAQGTLLLQRIRALLIPVVWCFHIHSSFNWRSSSGVAGVTLRWLWSWPDAGLVYGLTDSFSSFSPSQLLKTWKKFYGLP